MKFYICKEEITPHIPVFQAGFAGRTHKSEGIHDKPYATVLIIQENKAVVIISLDLLYGDRSFANSIKKAIYERFGLNRDEIVINYSHTHSVVSVTGEDEETRSHRPYSINSDAMLWGMDKKDTDYTEDVKYYNIIKDKILVMLDNGFKNIMEGEAFHCKGKSKFGVSRRYPHENGVLWKPYFNENAIDTDLFIIKLIDNTNTIRGIVYNYACHPTTLGADNYLISADFPGVVRKHLEERYPGSIPMFLQGCGADIKPSATAENGEFISCNFDQLDEAGKSFANEIQSLIDLSEDNSCWRKIDFNINTNCDEVKLYTETWDIGKWESIINDPNEPSYRKASAKKVLLDIKENKIKNYLPYYISVIKLDENLKIISLEGEVVCDIGKNIKKILSGEDIIVLGYSNSSLCYIPTKEVLLGGGYESMSFIAARLAGPFVPEVEYIIVGKAALLAKNI